ncbi:MAG TPA: hypothetical protein VK488_11365 [Gaiellaceae bacterium]|nr:hypothetical protein [Gaiellaceae bacterium]
MGANLDSALDESAKLTPRHCGQFLGMLPNLHRKLGDSQGFPLVREAWADEHRRRHTEPLEDR